ncbi:serine/threonine-protein kinase EDR1-like [Iris pallida]|uniref:non-specific serine/threonine protein kinase n=1 Tax=Iris pallida TaxID=29817 RepID=A0AAX6FJS8_IRIPA|nr:serine/threonine-protein kinase EDR1-like [Iris pallida]
MDFMMYTELFQIPTHKERCLHWWTFKQYQFQIIDYEVVLVNRTVDHALQQLESRAVSIVMESKAAELGPIDSGLVQKIADLVVDSMGGPVSDAEDMLRRWTSKSFELRTSLNTIVLPLGLLEIGLSRHRALLFKVLADLVNLPCKLVKGSYYTGTDEGAVNLIKVDYDNEYIVDLMGAPGVLIPAEVPSTHLQNPGLNLPTLDTIDQTVKDLCLALDNVNSQFEKKSQASEGSSSCGSSFSGSVGLPSEQRSRLGPSAAVDNQSNFEKITEKSGHEFGVGFPPMGRSRANTSGTSEVISPAQQMKVHDVSKYVVTAAKNPEFAQKLHAVLLESGASPPLDLFSDLNLSQNLVEQKELGNTEVQKDGQFPKHGELESLNCAADTRNKKSFAVDNSDSKGRNYDMFTSPTNVISPPFGTSNEDSSKQQFVNTAKELGSKGLKANVGKTISTGGTEGNGFHRESQETAKDSSVQLIGKDENCHHDLRYLDNERIHSLLDGVAEWEIPWGDLHIGERIGLGSYGEVYHADWNGTEVAVKKFLEQGLSGDALEQFRCEVKIMLRLRHPNVVLFMGAVTRPPNLSILTEFLPRGSLYRLLHRPNVKLDEKRRLKMALDVAKGMNYLHTSHPTIVHRDLKSPNLLVDRNWVVKVADFGLSRLKHHTFLSSKSTAGTPEWMAPEVLRNEPSNEKCDIYSFGVILWELATMRMPWSGMNPMQVVGAVGFQNRRLDIPKEVDPMIAKIITECWDSEPNQRPSFAQIMSTLKQLQHLVVSPT